MGIFSGSGVGKSTLLGMVARNMDADVNIIALIGERSREVREFVEVALGPEGLRRSVVVVATADQPALTRVKAAYVAASLAEYFRGQGRHVMLTVDSMTRLAMARREIGLAVGEPPTARGYTPSVFTEIPEFCERCGTAENGASITALFTVLVEGDDFNEPIADLMRSTLDGHIVLSRELANEGHFPAIDILQSVSRLARELTTPSEQTILAHGIADLAAYQRNRQMLDIGVYKPGANPQFDGVVARRDALTQFLRQPIGERTLRADALQALSAIYASRGRP